MQAALSSTSYLSGTRVASTSRASVAPRATTGVVYAATQTTRRERIQIRHKRIRSKGKPERPRLAVFRSNNHIYAQVIDDTAGSTLVAASTLTPEIREKLGGSAGGNKGAAELVGAKIAELCKAANIEAVAFDRGGNVYHGRVKALADAARAGGLSF